MTTLYDKYGGFATVNKLVQAFYGKVAELLEETLEDMSVEDADVETIMEIVNGVKSDIVTVTSDNK